MELNESGKFNVQQNLCEQYLGYSIFIDKLISNKLRISQLRRSERKDLFLKLYPSDLSFLSRLLQTCESAKIKRFEK